MQILARDLDLSGSGFEIEVGLADFGFDLTAGIVQLGLALRQHGLGLGDVAGFTSPAPTVQRLNVTLLPPIRVFSPITATGDFSG